jgi:hypothetical protein
MVTHPAGSGLAEFEMVVAGARRAGELGARPGAPFVSVSADTEEREAILGVVGDGLCGRGVAALVVGDPALIICADDLGEALLGSVLVGAVPGPAGTTRSLTATAWPRPPGTQAVPLVT